MADCGAASTVAWPAWSASLVWWHIGGLRRWSWDAGKGRFICHSVPGGGWLQGRHEWGADVMARGEVRGRDVGRGRPRGAPERPCAGVTRHEFGTMRDTQRGPGWRDCMITTRGPEGGLTTGSLAVRPCSWRCPALLLALPGLLSWPRHAAPCAPSAGRTRTTLDRATLGTPLEARTPQGGRSAVSTEGRLGFGAMLARC